MPRTLYLVDGFADGHHLTHLRNYAAAALAMGYRVVELLPEPARVAGWFEESTPAMGERLRLRSYQHPVLPIVRPWRWRRIIQPLRLWQAAARAVGAAERATGWKPDLVLFNWLDDYIVGVNGLVPQLLPAVFPYRWSGVFFHPWHLRIPDGPTRPDSVAAEAMLRSRGCVGVGVLDRWIAADLQRKVRKPVVVFPDETETAISAVEPEVVRAMRAAAAGRRLIVLPGVLARRKGVMGLLEAAAAARERPWCFAFIGVFDEGLRKTYAPDELARIDAAIRGELPNTWFHPARIEDEREFNAVIQAADVLYAAYELFAHSSGIVTKAGFFEKPILVSPGYCMAQDVAAYKLGGIVDPHDPAAVVNMLEILMDPARRDAEIGIPDYARFRKDYGVEALRPALERLLSGAVTPR